MVNISGALKESAAKSVLEALVPQLREVKEEQPPRWPLLLRKHLSSRPLLGASVCLSPGCSCVDSQRLHHKMSLKGQEGHGRQERHPYWDADAEFRVTLSLCCLMHRERKRGER